MSDPSAQKSLLHLELAKLLEAGFGIRDAIAAILKTDPPKDQVELLSGVDVALTEGKTISQAFGERLGMTDLERSMIGAGERGGRLAQAFRHLAEYYEMLAQTRREASHAMVQPIVLLHTGVFMATVPFSMIEGKTWVQAAVAFGIGLIVLYSGLFVVGVVARMALAAAPHQAWVDRLVNGLPMIGKARKALAMARFTRVYHMGLLAGLSMKEVVRMSLEASQSAALKEESRELLTTAEVGGLLGPEFVSVKGFPKAFSRSYETAEEAGGLDLDLERWAKFFQQDAILRVKAAAVFVPKVLYAVILAFIAWKIISFFLGYYRLLDHIEDYGAEGAEE